MRLLHLAVTLLMMILVAVSPALAERFTLEGEVTYQDDIALPAGGELTVTLIDLMQPDRPGLSAKAPIASPGKVPLTFTLNLDTKVLEGTHRYALVAQIAGSDGAVWFRNDEPFALDAVPPLAPIVIVVTYQGAFADPGAIGPAQPAAASPVLNATWQALSVGGEAVVTGSVSSLSIGTDMRAGGRGGCNAWFAQAQVGEQTIAFSAVASTRMACPDDTLMAQETAFFAALAATRFWRVAEDELTLLDAAGQVLAVFEKSPY